MIKLAQNIDKMAIFFIKNTCKINKTSVKYNRLSYLPIVY